MVISGWELKYRGILREFKYDMNLDVESAKMLDSIVKKSYSINKLEELIVGKPVIVVGAGPSLLHALPFLKKFKHTTKIVADSAIEAIVKEKINPEIIVTDLDGDEYSLKKMGKTETVFVVHAHGDNIEEIEKLVPKFKKVLGTTQVMPVTNVYNFGGFTDGDRAVFLAEEFGAKEIILVGMTFGNTVGNYSKSTQDIDIKKEKLKIAKKLLQTLAKNSRSVLYDTSKKPITGFKEFEPT